MERFELMWEGKAEALQVALQATTFALEPDYEASIDFENAPHIFIEGDNLDALKIMQKTYYEAIKLIYIDPPYNTGNDHFLYGDNFRTQKSERKNKIAQDYGHFHALWLNMMYPRLQLAHKLLKNDGVICISIDDNELFNLKIVMDEIFGAENFIANMVRQNKTGSGHDSAWLAVEYDYVLVYAKNKNAVVFNHQIIDVENDAKYKISDEHIATRGKYYLRDLDYKGTYSTSMDFPLVAPDGTILYAGGKQGEPNAWRWSKDKVKWGIENDFIVFKKNKDKWKIYIKQYQYADNEGNFRQRTLPYRALVHFLNGKGSQEIADLLGSSAYFSFPKSTELIQYLINMVCGKEDSILDFFAGSGTTAHAVLKQNAEDHGNRRFICVQRPEPLPANSQAYKKGYQTIADISQERIKQALKKLKTNVGIQFFRLSKLPTF